MNELVRPLTEEEKNPQEVDASNPRYIFEGTLQEAQEFFQQTEKIPQLYNNWRLPTTSELQSLFVEDPKYQGYQTLCGPQVNIVPQIRLSCILVWTSDMALGLPIAFDFNLGSAFTIDLHDNKGCRVLPVRSLQQ